MATSRPVPPHTLFLASPSPIYSSFSPQYCKWNQPASRDRDWSAQATASGSQLPLPEAAASLSSMTTAADVIACCLSLIIPQPHHPTAHSQGQWFHFVWSQFPRMEITKSPRLLLLPALVPVKPHHRSPAKKEQVPGTGEIWHLKPSLASDLPLLAWNPSPCSAEGP